MKKRVLSILLVLAMAFSYCGIGNADEISEQIVPEIVEQQTWTEAAQTATETITEAVQKEAAAGASALPSGNLEIAVEEGMAAVNDIAAGIKVEQAEMEVKIAEEIIDNRADKAEADAERAEFAEEKAEEHLHETVEADLEAIKDKHTAEDAQHTAENTGNVNVAKDAADTARAAADDAHVKAAEATADAGKATFDAVIAQQNANDAQKKYEQAQTVYDETVALVEKQLQEGLIDAKEAQTLTAEAAQEAEQYHEEVKEAVAAAEQKTADAQIILDDAKEALAADVKELEKIVAEGAVTLAQDTAVTAVTGAVLAAADIAKGIADAKVADYEEKIEDIKEQIGTLDEKLIEVDAEIARLEEEIRKEETRLSRDAKYYAAKLALDAAVSAKEKIEAVKANAEAVLQAKEDAQSELSMQDMAVRQANVKGGNPTPEDISNLTKDVLENIHRFDESVAEYKNFKTVEGQIDLFSYEDAEGKRHFVQAKVEGKDSNKYLQFYDVDFNAENVVKAEKLPLTKTNYSTSFTAVDANGGNYAITASRDSIMTPSWSYFAGDYPLHWTDDGNAYIQISKDETVPLTITKDGKTAFIMKKLSLTSNSITDKWTQAEKDAADAEKSLPQTLENLQKSQTAYDEVTKNLHALEESLKKAEEADPSFADRKQLIKDLEALDKELNGNLVDQVFRNVISDPDISVLIDEIGEKNREILENPYKVADNLKRLKVISDNIIELNKKLGGEILSADISLENVGEIVADIINARENAGLIAELIQGAGDGKLDIEDIGNLAELLTGNTISLKTKQVITGKIQGLAEDAHEAALDKLKKDFADTAKAVAAQTKTVAKDTAAAVEAELKFQAAKIEEEATKLKEADAAHLQKKAEEADAAAKEAVKAYEDLLAQKVDDTDLQRAKDARDAALNAAKKAWNLAKKAQAAAFQARLSADKAEQAAQKAFDAYRKLIPAAAATESGIDWDALRAINPDIVAWIVVPNTSINYPVVKGTDNEFYRTHGFSKADDENGCIFVDASCSGDFTGTNTVVHGNNTGNGMFTDLQMFLDAGSRVVNGKVTIYTPAKTLNYNEFAAASTVSTAALAKDYMDPAAPEGCTNTLTLATPSATAGENIIVSCALNQ